MMTASFPSPTDDPRAVRPGRLLIAFVVVWTANVLTLAGLALALLFGGIPR